MHATEIILRDGRRFEGVWIVEDLRYDPDVFENSYIKLYDSDERFYVKDIVSMVSKNERISVNEIGDHDDIKRMRELWEMHRDDGSTFRLDDDKFVEEEHRIS